MFTSKIANAVIGVGSVAAIISSQKLQAKDLVVCHECHARRLPKARELPLYDKEDHLTVEFVEESKLPLITEISVVRKKLFEYASFIDVFRKKVITVYDTGLAHSQSSYDYLKDEENLIPRVLIISSGGLVGYLFARRGGIFRKLLFTSMGTGAIFSVFYPTLTKDYFSTGFEFAKHHTATALEKYGGYDTDKLSQEAKDKVDYMLGIMDYKKLMKKLEDIFSKSKVSESDSSNKSEISNTKVIEKEDTQRDKDLYTTRT